MIISVPKGYKDLFIAFVVIIIFYLLFNEHFVKINITVF